MSDIDREQEGGDVGNLGGDGGIREADGAGNNDNINHRHNARGRGRGRGRAPFPVWLRDEVGGRMERVERTPFNVVMQNLDDPFPDDGNNGGGGVGGAEENEGDDHDSVESDDENNLVTLEGPQDPGMSGLFLEDLIGTYRRYRLRDFTVTFDEDELIEPSELPGDFRRFVRALHRYGRIRTLHLTQGNFGRVDPGLGGAGVGAQEGNDRDGDDDFGLDISRIVGEACLEELFGTVLCKHTSLCSISFSYMRIPTRYWRLFTEGFGTIDEGVLVHLELQSTPFTMEGCQLLKRMCQRKARVSLVSLEDCGLGAEEWRTVCEGVADSGGETNYVSFWEEDATVGPDTLLPLLRAPAAVEFLSVRAAQWAVGAFEGFVRELRTTETTLYVRLQNYLDIPSLRLVEELLTTYNCMLEEFAFYPADEASQGRINALLERNTRIRSLYKPGSRNTFKRYHLSRKSMWPHVVAEYGRLPTQLYRFVRHGNLEGFVSQVEDVAATAPPAAAPVVG